MVKPISFAGAAAVKRRSQVRQEFWPTDIPWEGPDEVGYFCAPRSLPMILAVLGQKNISGDKDPTSVYVEILARHAGQGVVEMTHHEDHAFGAGYAGVRAWRDRMKVLEDAGFIKAISAGNRHYAKVFLVHPSIAMANLRAAGKISDEMWQAYRSRQIEAKEPKAEDVVKRSAEKKT